MHRPAETPPTAALAILLAVAALPLLGALAAGRDLGPLSKFPPPLSVPTTYPRFSWLALVLIVSPFVALGVAWWRAAAAKRVADEPDPQRNANATRRHYPAWGWAAVLWTGIWWGLAWTRFPWFEPVQRFTFFPLWFGFIVAANAAVVARTGSCTMTRTPGRWLAMFATSAVFWWMFEWLNRFSENWHYLGVNDFGPAAYALNATLCFSTVLPAVAGVREWLGSVPSFQTACVRGPKLRWIASGRTAAVLLVASATGLVGTGAEPMVFYPALWAAPLALAVSVSTLCGSPRLVSEVASGDWQRAATWAVSALVCGFFWEMWNLHSAAKWIYTVPYADVFRIFEMPLLGYLGYLPFGLECYFVVERLSGDRLVD